MVGDDLNNDVLAAQVVRHDPACSYGSAISARVSGSLGHRQFAMQPNPSSTRWPTCRLLGLV